MLTDLDLERAIVGAVVLRPSVVTEIAGELAPSHFADSMLGRLFGEACALAERGEQLDVVTLAQRVGAGPELWEQLGAYADRGMHAANNIARHAARLRKLAHGRAITEEAARIVDDSRTHDPETFVDHAASTLGPLLTLDTSGTTPLASDLLPAVLLDLTQSDRPPGVPTHWRGWDSMMQGLHGGRLYTVAGRPGHGKSVVALNLVRACGLPSIMFSLEMSAAELLTRDLCRCSGVDGSRVQARRLSTSERAMLVEAKSILERQVFAVDDRSSIGISEVRVRARSFVRSHGLRGARVPALVVVDYLQLLDTDTTARTRDEALGRVTRGLKKLAGELHVPVVALSQIRRDVDQRSSHVPTLSDLRESGSIEQDSDVVVGLHRPECYKPDERPGQLDLHVLKQRNGPIGTFTMSFDPKISRLTD